MIFKNKQDFKVFIVLALLAMASIGVINNCVGVFYSALAQGLNEKIGRITFYVTITSATSTITEVFVQKFLNQKNYKRIITGCTAVAAISLVLIGQAKSIYQIYLFAVTLGLAEAFFCNSIINQLIVSNLSENVGKISSLIFLSSGIAGIVLSPFLTTIIENYNYSIAYAVSAVLVFVLSMPLYFIDLKVDFKDKKNQTKQSSSHKINDIVIIYIIMSCIMFAISVFSQYFITYGKLKGLDAIQAAYLLSASMAGNVTFKLVNGVLVDKIGTLKTAMLITVTNFIGLLLLYSSCNFYIMLFACFIYGSNFSLTSFMHSLLCRDLFKDSYFSVFPIVMFAGAAAYSITSSLYGYCFDLTGSYNVVIYTLMAFDVVDLMFMIRLKNITK